MRWNTGVSELDMDLPGVQLSRIVDASYRSVNFVPCPALVTVGDLLPGLVSVDDFQEHSSKVQIRCGLLLFCRGPHVCAFSGHHDGW